MKKDINIVAIGEVLWDMLPEGKQLGGAPANFTFYCNELGLKAHLVSAVGNDPLGEELLQSLPYDVSSVLRNSKPTSQVDIILEHGIPTYNIREKVAWDYLELNETHKGVLRSCKAICFGTLAQRKTQSKKTIHNALDIVPEDCMKIFDINLRQNYYSIMHLEESLNKSDLLKINDEELEILSTLFGISGSEQERVKALMNKYKIKLLALTKGESGSYVFSEMEQDYQPIIKTEIQDTIGAGDAFLAGLVTGLLSGLSIKEAHKKACQVSSFVCGQKGAMNPLNKKKRN